MNWKSALAIYVLFWVFSVFLVLPFGMRTVTEAGQDVVPGSVESAPSDFSLKRIAKRTTIVATIAFMLFLLNYNYGWITVETLDWAH